MNLLVKNNFLYTARDTLRCAIGRNGLTKNKIEGDMCTPVGEFKFDKIYYRADRLDKLNFLIPSHSIDADDGWCDDPSSKLYNQFIKFPFNESAERLHRDDGLYDLICVISYNTDPIVARKGSAIFLHICKPNFESTEGCVAIEKSKLIEISQEIDLDTKITISY